MLHGFQQKLLLWKHELIVAYLFYYVMRRKGLGAYNNVEKRERLSGQSDRIQFMLDLADYMS